MIFGSIRSRLLALVIAGAVPGLIVLVWVFVDSYRRQSTFGQQAALRIARAMSSDIAAANRSSHQILEQMSHRPELRLADARACGPLLGVVDFLPQYPNLILYDGQGRRSCSATPQSRDLPASSAAEEAIARRLRSGGALREPLVLNQGDRWLSVTFQPVRSGDVSAGTLALIQYLDLDLDAFRRGTVVNLIDRSGLILARAGADKKWVGTNLRGTALGRAAMHAASGSTEAHGADGTLRQYGFCQIAGTSWTLVVGIPARVAMDGIRPLLLRAVVMAVFIIIGVVPIALSISRTIARPLRNLTRAAERIATAGYTDEIRSEGPRETAILANAFNAMVQARTAAEAALSDSSVELEALSKRLVDVQEEERQRIAREIHDELGQMVTALHIDVGGLLESVSESDFTQQRRSARIRQALGSMLISIQRISAELRPVALDDFGLIAAIESELRLFEERTGIECAISFPDHPLPLAADVELAVYRIIQEALTNVARHAGASRVEIVCQQRAGQVLIELRDDGCGISAEAIGRRTSLGIVGMRERAKTVAVALDIEGVAGKGTVVAIRVSSATSLGVGA